LIKIKAHQALLVWAFVFYQMRRRSLALKLFSTCSQWEDGPHGPRTNLLSPALFSRASTSDRHLDGSFLRSQSGFHQG
jgi:hypothetical protein